MFPSGVGQRLPRGSMCAVCAKKPGSLPTCHKWIFTLSDGLISVILTLVSRNTSCRLLECSTFMNTVFMKVKSPKEQLV